MINRNDENIGETEDLLNTLALAAGFEPIRIDFDRGVWILLVKTIEHEQLEFFSLSLENHNLKHVAVEFSK